MFRFCLILLAVTATTAVPAYGAFVPPFGDSGAALQAVIDGITVSPPSSVNVMTDGLPDLDDSYWQVNGGTGSASTIAIELAGLASTNKFGIYDAADPTKMVQIFSGPDGGGATKFLQIGVDGSILLNFVDTGVDFGGNNFGYYIDTDVPGDNRVGPVFYSDTGLNDDDMDHMVAYQGTGDPISVAPYTPGPWGPNQWMLAFEDLEGGQADNDFEDLVVLAESVSPHDMPEPTSFFAWGGLTGLFGFVALRRRRPSSD